MTDPGGRRLLTDVFLVTGHEQSSCTTEPRYVNLNMIPEYLVSLLEREHYH